MEYFPGAYLIIGNFDCAGNWYRVVIVEGISYILTKLGSTK